MTTPVAADAPVVPCAASKDPSVDHKQVDIAVQEEAILVEPFEYIRSVPGKKIRVALINAFNKWMEVPEDKLDVIKDITAMLHNASLLIDDIEDGSKLRRGIPVAHSVFGVPMTINSANYVYFKCLQKVAALGDIHAVEIFSEQLVELHMGQGMDIYWRESCICPTEEEYKTMVRRKTGGLFKLAIRLMQRWSEADINVYPLLDTIGLLFQIRDDYANLQLEEYSKNKSFCEDITEGKFSFPIIHSIHMSSHSRLMNILKQHVTDEERKLYCLQLMRETGSFRYTRVALERLHAQAVAEISRLGGNAILAKILDQLKQAWTGEAKHVYVV